MFYYAFSSRFCSIISIPAGCLISMGIAFAVKLFGDSSFLLVLIIMILYGLSIETLAFMFTPMFQKAKTAAMVASFATILMSVISLVHGMLKTSNAIKWITSLLSPIALSLALREVRNLISRPCLAIPNIA